MGSTINNNLRRKAEAWTGERANAAAADDDEDLTLMDIDDKESEEEGGRRVLPSRRPRSASAARRSGTAAAACEARRSGTVAAGGRPQKGEYQANHIIMVDSHVNKDRIDEEGQTLVPVVVDGKIYPSTGLSS